MTNTPDANAPDPIPDGPGPAPRASIRPSPSAPHSIPDGPGSVPSGEDEPQETDLLCDLQVVMDRRASAGPLSLAGFQPLEGRRIGQYVIARLLGEGGMARVYQAFDAQGGSDVAFKVLKPPYHTDRKLCARFEREARTMARIRHDHVVRILGFPKTPGVRAIVMELLTGGSLRDRLDRTQARERRLAIPEAVSLIAQAAAGVQAAHAMGIVHRDLKPSNLLLAADGRAKVADFGTILVLEGTTWLTGVGQQIGTPGYMSPEQCRGDRVTPASDVYSLGATLFELVTGRLPFDVEEASPLAIMLKHISEPVPDPRIWREEIPEWLAAVLLKCLEKQPADRYACAGELGHALRAGPPAPLTGTLQQAGDRTGQVMDLSAVREQLRQLPQRAIVCWACRCARRVQHLNADPRVEQALAMAESMARETGGGDAGDSLSRALTRIRVLRAASLRAAYPDEESREPGAAAEAARAAAAAASAAAARCIADAAADAAFAARSAMAALTSTGDSLSEFWRAARRDFRTLEQAGLGAPGTIGRPVPPSLLDDATQRGDRCTGPFGGRDGIEADPRMPR